MVSARSNHPGGVNVVFGDFRGDFVKDTIALEVWFAYGTAFGQETIDE